MSGIRVALTDSDRELLVKSLEHRRDLIKAWIRAGLAPDETAAYLDEEERIDVLQARLRGEKDAS